MVYNTRHGPIHKCQSAQSNSQMHGDVTKHPETSVIFCTPTLPKLVPSSVSPVDRMMPNILFSGTLRHYAAIGFMKMSMGSTHDSRIFTPLGWMSVVSGVQRLDVYGDTMKNQLHSAHLFLIIVQFI